MSEAYDMLLSQRHEAALEAKIEAQEETIHRLQDAIRYAINQFDCLGKLLLNEDVTDAIEQRLLDALEE